MASMPLIERELRVAVRKRRPVRVRLKIAFWATVASMIFLIFGPVVSVRFDGSSLEEVLCIAGVYFVWTAPRLVAGALSEERQNQTLGLLFVSGLSAWDIFTGKFLSSTLIAFTNLLAIFPLLALPFLVGGIAYPVFMAIVCALPAVMLFALAITLLASVLTRGEGEALTLSRVMTVLVCGLPVAVNMALPFRFTNAWWLCLSPGYGPYLVWRGISRGFQFGEQAEFWQNMAVTLGWAVAAVILAAYVLTRVWRDQEENHELGGWRARWRDIWHGRPAFRQALAKRWLPENPYVWLAGRNRQPVVLGWMLMGGIVSAWLLCWAVWGAAWVCPLNFYLTAVLLNLTMNWLILYTAARQFGGARREGAYELLLTTSLEVRDIVRGQISSIQESFLPLLNFILLLDALMIAGGLLARKWTLSALGVYGCLWVLMLMWTLELRRRWSRALPVAWVSLNSGRPLFAVWRASGFHTGDGLGWWYWMFMGDVGNVLHNFHSYPTGSNSQLLLTGFITLVLVVAYVGKRVSMKRRKYADLSWDQEEEELWRPGQISPNRRFWELDPRRNQIERTCGWRLIHEMREIVREPLPDPHDPRFKKWNVFDRFPWGWRMAQGQLLERLGRRAMEPGALWKSRE